MKKKLTKIIIGITLLLIIGGFSPSLFAANEIFTGTAIDITGNSAKLLFSVENEVVTKAGVSISKTTGFNNPPNVFSCDYLTTYNGKGNYEVTKSGLDNGSIYYYQACGTDANGNNYLGEEKYFTTNSNNECTVESMSFSGNAENWDIDGEVTNIKIVTKNCNDGIRISPKALKGIGSNIETKQIFINGKPNLLIPNSYGEIEIKVKISTAGCYSENGTDPNNGWRYRCVNFLEIYNEAGTLIKTGNDPVLTPSFIRAQDTAEKRVTLRKKGVLLGNCGSFCNYGSDNPAEGDEDNWIFQKPIIKGTVGGPDGGSDCILSSGEGIDDPSDVYFDKIEEEDIIGRTARLNIQTSNGCRSKALLIKLFEVDPIKNLTKNLEENEDDFIYVESPSEGKLILDFQIDEDYCLDSTNPDCEVYVEIYENESLVFSSEKWMDGSEVSPSSNDFKNKVNFKKGVIGHNCGGLDFMCSLADTDWIFLYTNGKLLDFGGIPPDPLNVNLLDLEEYFDPQSPCYAEPGEILGPSNKKAGDKGGYKEDCYELLAPIPGIGEDTKNNGRFSIDFSSYQIGQYIQSLFNVALGMLMLLSVIMIIVAGVEYMTVESIFGKSRAKGRITGAMTGLILGLGIFIILRTINPQLLEINFGSKVETVTLDAGGGLGMDIEGGGTPVRPSGGDNRALDPQWAMENAPVLKFTKGSEIIAVKACDEASMTTFKAFGGKTIKVRKELKPTVLRISEAWEAQGSNQYPIETIGGYNCRTIKQGGKSISTHSYGITLDINFAKNPYGSTLITDMPESFRKLFTDEGFGWGGNWTSIKDAMHFSKQNGTLMNGGQSSNEQGDQKF